MKMASRQVRKWCLSIMIHSKLSCISFFYMRHLEMKKSDGCCTAAMFNENEWTKVQRLRHAVRGFVLDSCGAAQGPTTIKVTAPKGSHEV